MWQQITSYFKVPLNTLSRALNPQLGRNIEERNQLERLKEELNAALSIRIVDNSAIIAVGRRGFIPEFRFWVRKAGFNL